MSIKTFLMKKMLANQMKGVPQAEQDKILAILEKDPSLFQKIAEETQAEMKKGKDQQEAALFVAKKYETELKKLM
jgi:2-oxo-4-hydroxy-4-carboxy--5-ureidoimidazoline (OHCU) decarboxylase